MHAAHFVMRRPTAHIPLPDAATVAASAMLTRPTRLGVRVSTSFTIAPLPTPDDDADSAARLARLPPAAAKLAFYRVLGQSPAVLQGFLSLKDALGGGRLAPLERESLAVLVAQANGCGYCLAAHAGTFRRLGGSEEALLAARTQRAATPRVQSLLDVGASLLALDGAVDPEPARRARAAGITDEELLEVAAHVALNVFSNAVNLLASTPLDLPPVPLEIEPSAPAPAAAE